jgi:2-oxoisovalerate dehydrogenase E2 component (dihydrolipoyl transacylase)
MARQVGVDLADVAGHGPDGIVTRDDLAAYIGGRAGQPGAAPAGPIRTPVRGIQKRMAEAMLRSVAEAPQACVFLSVDVSESTALVERLRANREFDG